MPKLLRRHRNHFTFPPLNSKEHVFRFTAELKEREIDGRVRVADDPSVQHEANIRSSRLADLCNPTAHLCAARYGSATYIWLLKLTHSKR
jgi:hypothetical protein